MVVVVLLLALQAAVTAVTGCSAVEGSSVVDAGRAVCLPCGSGRIHGCCTSLSCLGRILACGCEHSLRELDLHTSCRQGGRGRLCARACPVGMKHDTFARACCWCVTCG